MKLIIELDDFIAKGIRGENDCKVKPGEIVRIFQTTIAEAIKNGTPPYFPLPEDVFYKITDAEWEHSDSFWITTPSGKKIEFEKKRSQELANEVWELYEKYHPYLATRVYEFGNELKDLLGKYQKGGAE